MGYSKITSQLTRLPINVLAQVVFHLLGNPPVIAPTSNLVLSETRDLSLEESFRDVHSLLCTCSALRHLDLPSSIWRLWIFSSVARFTSSLISRWRANPGSLSSTNDVLSALDEVFADPIRHALARHGYREVWDWWSYSLAWRSRRRVWYCMIHACSAARDADWW